MKENHINVQRTARYYTTGEFTIQTNEIWIVAHGYGQLAKEFIKHFEVLKDSHRFFIAPEGMNKFYARGVGGPPVANWMTSEDRLNEITDYVALIDAIVEAEIPEDYDGRIILFGFSQGVATITRWLNHTRRRIDELIIYAGSIALELANPIADCLLLQPVTYITGRKDPLIKPEQKNLVLEQMKQINARIIEFDGGHEILPEVILLLAK